MSAGLRGAAGIGLALVVLLAGGCASHGRLAGGQEWRETEVGQRMIDHTGSGRYAMEPHQAFVMPVLESAPLPQFSPDYAMQSLPPTTLCSALVVQADGSVSEGGLVSGPGCIEPGQAPPELAAAVVDALGRWRFSPALLCTYPDAAARNREWMGRACDGQPLQAEPVPVTLAWAFTFQVRNGRHEVVQARTGAR